MEKLTVSQILKKIYRVLWNSKFHKRFCNISSFFPYRKPDESNPRLPSFLFIQDTFLKQKQQSAVVRRLLWLYRYRLLRETQSLN